jgi:hypothetical protein
MSLALENYVRPNATDFSTAILSAFATLSTISSAITAATGAGRPLFARPGFIDSHGATINLLAVETLNGRLGGFLGIHGDKPEAARAAAEFVHDHVHFDDVAVGSEQILQLILGCVEGKISHKQFRIH